ncbi:MULTISPECIES: DMT family transporter [unclassified Dyella]|jgi:drug/metabolite transporter (DMT)-like permease|uniref:DMT family transporter n=1 Tax=unclassified Dyella TaxID=2634549 RepID=UPI003F930CA1
MSMKLARFYAIGFTILVLFDTLVQLSFKYAGDHAFPPEANWAWILRVFGHPWIYVAVIGYVGNFFTWMTLLKHAPIGPAFAVTHLEVVSVMLFSVWLFHEPLTASRIIGAVAIVAGIICLAFAESGAHPEGDAPTEAKGALGVVAGD